MNTAKVLIQKVVSLCCLSLLSFGCNVANQPAVSTAASVNSFSSVQFNFTNFYLLRGETAGTVSVPFTFSAPLPEAVTLEFTFAGTATWGIACTPGVDFTYPTTTLVLPAGTLFSALDFIICNDDTYEANETLIVTLINSTPSLQLGSQFLSEIIIQDSLSLPTLSFAASSTVAAEPGAGVVSYPVTVNLSHKSSVAVSFNIATGGTVLSGDFSLPGTTFTIPAGSLNTVINVDINSDAYIESNETLQLFLASPSQAALAGILQHEISITPFGAQSTVEVGFAAATTSLAESSTTLLLTVNVSGSFERDTAMTYTVDVATAVAGRRAVWNEDFRLTTSLTSTGTLNLPMGAGPTVTIPITILNDALYEPNEKFVITLVGNAEVSVVGTASHEITITTNDVAPLVGFEIINSSVSENNLASMVAIILTDPASPTSQMASGDDVTITLGTVNGTTGGSGVDWFLGATTLTIPAGTTRFVVPVTAIQDYLLEGLETFDINFSVIPAPYGAATNNTHTVNILDTSL